MSTEELIRLIFSFLGGGTVVGIIEWIRQISAAKELRKFDYLNKQLINLYGPLYFFTSQNEILFKLNEKLGEAHKIEYEDVKWSNDKDTMEGITKESTITNELRNSYMSVAVENNDKILDLLKNNYQFIDTSDVIIFQEFITDYVRFKKEINEDGNIKTPLRIYIRIGSISFMKPEFINRVAEKFNLLNQEIKKYQAK